LLTSFASICLLMPGNADAAFNINIADSARKVSQRYDFPFSISLRSRSVIYLCVLIHAETRMYICIITSHKTRILSRSQHGEHIASRAPKIEFFEFTQRIPRSLARLGYLARRSRMDVRMDHDDGSCIKDAQCESCR